MKNLKRQFEKDDVNFWQDTTIRVVGGMRTRKFREGKSGSRMGLEKRSPRFRATWG